MKKQTNEKEVNDNIKLILYLIIFFLGIIAMFITEKGGFFLISILSIITAKLTYPKNMLVKILFWPSIAYLIYCTILIIFLLIICSGLE